MNLLQPPVCKKWTALANPNMIDSLRPEDKRDRLPSSHSKNRSREPLAAYSYTKHCPHIHTHKTLFRIQHLFLAKSCARDSRSITSLTICATLCHILLAIDVLLRACHRRDEFIAQTLHDDFLICCCRRRHCPCLAFVNVALNVRVVRALRARLNSNKKRNRCRSQAVLICRPRLLKLMQRDQRYIVVEERDSIPGNKGDSMNGPLFIWTLRIVLLLYNCTGTVNRIWSLPYVSYMGPPVVLLVLGPK